MLESWLGSRTLKANGSLLLGPWYVVALQEASSHLSSDALADPALLLNKHTSSVPKLSTSKRCASIPVGLLCSVSARFRLGAGDIVRLFCGYRINHFAKRRSVVLLGIWEVTVREEIDPVKPKGKIPRALCTTGQPYRYQQLEPPCIAPGRPLQSKKNSGGTWFETPVTGTGTTLFLCTRFTPVPIGKASLGQLAAKAPRGGLTVAQTGAQASTKTTNSNLSWCCHLSYLSSFLEDDMGLLVY